MVEKESLFLFNACGYMLSDTFERLIAKHNAPD